MKRIASVEELNSPGFRAFMAWINSFARVHGLRTHTHWSKIWEYPWSWNRVGGRVLQRAAVLEIGSELSPIPWFFASLGASVRMVEADRSHQEHWLGIRSKQGFDVRWDFVNGPQLPMPDESFDVVTSYSVLEHIPEKETALREAARVLRPGGLLCLTFDICEPALCMSFPEWNGTALEMETFDRLVEENDSLELLDPKAVWNLQDVDPFLQWHRQTAPHHNYVVGGAILRKKGSSPGRRPHGKSGPVRVHLLDTGLGSGNTGDDAMFLAAHAHLPSGLELSAEIHSLERAKILPAGVRYLSVSDTRRVEESITACDLALLVGDTPVMDQWGLDWPLLANEGKLRLCHALKKPVHAVGVGVDRLADPKALRIFGECLAPIASWSIRSAHCKEVLLELGVAEDKIVLGADWAWLFQPKIDSGWAREWLSRCGVQENKINIGINPVNEMWRDDQPMKSAWAALLDRIVERFDAQLVFFCNESRPGDYFDRAAAEDIRSRMRRPSVLLPDRYYEAAEMIALISRMRVTISQRYHFTLFSVLGDVCPISIQRGQKMLGLNEELGLPYVGDMKRIDGDQIEREVAEILDDPGARLRELRLRRNQLEARAQNNLAFVKEALSRRPPLER